MPVVGDIFTIIFLVGIKENPIQQVSPAPLVGEISVHDPRDTKHGWFHVIFS
jgi:hypothetical protein